jgi:hypothetical protein
VIRGDDLTVHLAQSDGATSRKIGSLYMHVYDTDQLADDWQKAGLKVVGPEDYDYGKREGSHKVPDGNLIRFGSPLREQFRPNSPPTSRVRGHPHSPTFDTARSSNGR